MIRKWIHGYFGFNRQQQNGMLVLSSIILFLLIIRMLLPYMIKTPLIEIGTISFGETYLDSIQNSENEHHLFAFDPNTVSREDLELLGFKPKLAKTFIKFRNTGFKFKSKSDLKKLYGLNETFYAELEPYIIIKGTGNGIRDLRSTKKNVNAILINLNAADSIELLKVNGIGPVFAKNILKYRRMLGGFYDLQQLREVYGIDEERFRHFTSQLKLNGEELVKIDLNKASFKEILKHPYFDYELTKLICKTRDKKALNTTELQAIVQDDKLFQKILPYIKF